MTKKLNLQTGAEAEAFSFADIDKPWGAGGEGLYIDALGHEEDPVGGNRREAGQEILNFDQIVFG
jgi:hypothetical protein